MLYYNSYTDNGEGVLVMLDVSHLWSAIYGNEALKKRLIADISQNRLSHAHIVEGPAHSGKLTLIRTVAAAMCSDMGDVNKIFSGISPDMYEISLSDNKKSIGIETVREIRASVYIKPNDLDFKFYIISHADCLTVHAQNALLKLIEEPPRNVYFWLLCENVTALLPTIRSRAAIARMQIFSAEELKSYLFKYSQEAQRLERRSPEVLTAIARSSGGSYGAALLKLQKENDVSSIVKDCISLMEAFVAFNSVSMLSHVYRLPSERDAFSQTVQKLRVLVRDILAYRITSGACEFLFDDSSCIEEFSGQLSLSKLLALDGLLADIEKDFYVNPNIQNLKTQLYVKLCDI